MKNFWKITQNALVVIIIVIGILVVLTAFPIASNWRLMTVLSGSMEPTISTGSIVIVKNTEEYRPGDIISFNTDKFSDVSTTHRIEDMRVESGVPIYITKGDANDAQDTEEVLGRDIIGRVVFRVPILGYVTNFVKKPFGFLLVILIPAVYIVFEELRKVYREIKRIKKDKGKVDDIQDDEIRKLESKVKELEKELGDKKEK